MSDIQQQIQREREKRVTPRIKIILDLTKDTTVWKKRDTNQVQPGIR